MLHLTDYLNLLRKPYTDQNLKLRYASKGIDAMSISNILQSEVPAYFKYRIC